MEQATTIGLVIAKHVFHVHGADAAGHVRHLGTQMPSGASTLYHRRRLVSRSHMLARRVHPLGVTRRPPRASSTMMGHVPQRVATTDAP